MKEIKEKKYNDIYLGEYYYIGPEVYNFMPEVFDTADKPNDLFTATADIWALGMVIFEMVKMDKKETNVHRAKYGEPMLDTQIQRNEHHFIPDYYGKDIHQVLDLCLRVDPLERPTI
jgi:serine/threonine protein kinase